MNFEVFAIVPPDGQVIQICVRCGAIEFPVGFCRQIILFENHIEFVAPFRRATNASMTVAWAERMILQRLPIQRYTFELQREERWMNLEIQPGALR